MPFALLLLLFIAVPIAELYVIIEVVGEAIGPVWTIALLLADSVLGSLLLRQQGRSAWRRFVAATEARRVPGREIVDGLLIVVGGALLITPGFLTDVAGILLLLPPTRALARRALVRTLARRAVTGFAAAGARRTGTAPGPATAYDVEGTATEQPAPPGGRQLPERARLER